MSSSPYPDKLFSRQQLQQLTAIPDDVLQFWLRESILSPVGNAPRKHRRFTFDQLHLAAVLNAMRGLGANINVLRKFATLTETGKAIAQREDLTKEAMINASFLGRRLSRFRQGHLVRVLNPAYDFNKSPWQQAEIDMHEDATTEQQVIEDTIRNDLDGYNDRVIAVASALTEDEAEGLGAYENLLINHVSGRNRRFDWVWVAWIDEEGRPVVRTGGPGEIAWGRVGEEKMPRTAAFYITASTCIRDIWDRAGLKYEPIPQDDTL